MPEVFGTAPRGGSIASFRAQVNRDGSLPQGLSRKYGAGSLVEVVGLEDGGLRFEGVFLNGLHSLRRISLKNTSANVGEGGGSTVVVRLGSTVGDQVRFQLSNPNCPDSLPTELRHLATNTAGAADKLAYLESNALFDSVGFVREVTIAPGETQSVVVAFRPDSAHSRPSSAPFLDPSATAATRPDSYSEHGLSSVSILEGSSLSSFVGSGPAPKAAEQYALATVDGYLNFDACLLPLPGDTTPQATLVPIQQLSIKLSATVCRSHFTVSIAKPSDPSEVFVDWGNQCVVGEVYIRDFEISNRSGIELFWRLDDPEGVASGRGTGSPFLVTDFDKGHYLGSAGSEWIKPASIPPYGSRKLRFIFRPAEAKEVDAEIAFENIGDPDNTIQIHFHAVVASAPRDNTLRLLSGSTIDFCDCVAGEWSQQVIVFKNAANTALEVAFGADKGMDITFRLEGGADAHSALDLDSTSIGANAVELVAPPESEAPELPETSSAPSRTIIHELARGPRGSTSALITSGSSDFGAVLSHSPHSTQSNQFFVASPTSSDQASDSLLSTSDMSPPLSYHPAGGFRDARSPLGPNNPSSTQSSRSATPLPPSKSMHAENSEGGLFRVQDHLKVFEQQNASRIEDIYAKPGVEYRIVVSFRPIRAPSIDLDPDGGRLVKKTFRVTVSYRPWGVRGASGPSTKERKAIVCKARVCTSFIAVRPEVIDFGEVELGTSASGTVSIANLSEIPARVDLRFISKVLSAYRDEITIDVGKTIDIRLDIVPRRTNPAYQKQVSIHNLLNPANSQVCLVKSKNVDTRGVAYHSLFYRLLTSTGGNFEDFGSVPVGAYGLRGIAILNTSSESNLSLELSSAHPEDYELFVRRRAEPSPPAETLPASNFSSPPPSSPRPTQSRTNSSEIEARVELKERVLDAIFAPTPTAPPAHVRRPPSSNASATSSSTAAAARSIAMQLKQGLKVKATQMYGSGMAFKDRGVLSKSEYLDLATGPPLDISRTSPRSKRAILLDSIERSRPSRPSALALTTIAVEPASSGASSVSSHSRTRTEEPRIVEIGSSTSTVPAPPAAPATPTKRKTSRTPKEASSASSSSPALTSRRRTRNLFTMPTDPAKLSLDEVLSGLEHHSAHPDSSQLSSPELEDAYVRRFIALRRALKAALKSGELEPVSMLEVPPSSEQIVYILVHPAGTRTQIQGTSRKQDGKISIRLRAPDTGVACPASTDIPLREVVLRWTTCRSAMDLGMAHLNFGILEKSSSKAKKIVIANASEIPLLYSVRKSGSIASGDIRLSEGRHGVIPGYTKREVPIIFNPHYAGTFEETLHVDNVEDGTEETVRLKAYIRKPPTFSCSPPVLDFGTCAVHSSSTSLPLTITNTSKVPRVFTLSVDPAEFCFARTISEVILDPSTTSAFPTLTTEEEEEVDAMLQKLKISRRKGQPDKVVKYVARLSELGVAVPVSDEVAAAISLDEGSTVASPIESDVPTTEGAGEDEVESKDPTTTPEPKMRASSITFALEPNSRRDVMIALLPTPNPLPSEEDAGSPAKEEEISGAITIYENADATEKVVVKAVITL